MDGVTAPWACRPRGGEKCGLDSFKVSWRTAVRKDPIVEEVRRSKEAQAKRYNYDVWAMANALQAAQRKHRKRLVTLSPRRPPVAAKR